MDTRRFVLITTLDKFNEIKDTDILPKEGKWYDSLVFCKETRLIWNRGTSYGVDSTQYKYLAHPVPTKEKLYDINTWRNHEGFVYAYPGMSVTVADTGDTYVLILDENDFTEENLVKESSWYCSTDWEVI